MLTSARNLAPASERHSDVCIVGAGPAGITLARELRGSGFSVLLLESGGLELTSAAQDLNRGPHTGYPEGYPHYELDQNRLRMFGGTSRHWAGFCRPMEPTDFERRADLPHSGWPFSADRLVPYYRRAMRVLRLGPPKFEARDWQRALGTSGLSLDGTGFRNIVDQVSWPPMFFGETYRRELENARDVEVLLDATTTHIALSPSRGRVDHLIVMSDPGRKLTVRSRAYVLATGAIENARLLLASNDVQPGGVGNGQGIVGRFFCEHPHVRIGVFAGAVPLRTLRFYDRREPGRGDRFFPLGAIMPTRTTTERTGMIGWTARLNRIRGGDPDEAEEFVGFPKARFTPRDVLAMMPGDPVDPRAAIRDVLIEAEMEPSPDNRVALVDDRDRLGTQRVGVRLRLSDRDISNILEGARRLATALGRTGAGRVRLFTDEELRSRTEDGRPRLVAGAHHMGTTRMARSPRRGVTDPDGRVHGVADLYIAGSSLFPTVGASNPTLTIVALAIRLADHLKLRLR